MGRSNIERYTNQLHSHSTFKVLCWSGLVLLPVIQAFLALESDPNPVANLIYAVSWVALLIGALSETRAAPFFLRNWIIKNARWGSLAIFLAWTVAIWSQGPEASIGSPAFGVTVLLLFTFAFLAVSWRDFLFLGVVVLASWLHAFWMGRYWESTQESWYPVIRLNLGAVSLLVTSAIAYYNRRFIREQCEKLSALQERGAVEQKIINQGLHGVILLDSSGQTKFWANEAASDLLGYTPEEFNLLGVSEIWPEEEKPKALGLLADTRTQTKATLPEFLLRKKNGTRLPVMATGLFVDYFGKSYIALLFQDISPLKLLHEKLLQTAKLASIGELVAGVAHELNNPLSALRLHSELINSSVEGIADPSRTEVQESIRMVDGCIDRMQKIISGLKKLSRPSVTREYSEMDFNQLIDQTLLLYGKKLSNEKICLNLELDPDLPKVVVDAQQIEQVLVNLLANAVDAMGSTSDKKITIRTQATAEGITCIVSDTGMGIPVENRARIFDPFFSTKEIGKGTGLGLALSFSIIKEHQGELTLLDRSSPGTSFSIWLPATGMNAMATKAPSAGGSDQGNRELGA